MITGLNFKLDVGLYRLYQQVACQRYRQTQVIAKLFDRAKEVVASVFTPQLSFATAVA